MTNWSQTGPKRRSPPMENVRAQEQRSIANTVKPTADPTTSAQRYPTNQ